MNKAEHLAALQLEHPEGSLTKMVNGIEVTVDNAERDKLLNDWAEVRAKKDEVNEVRDNGGNHDDYGQLRREAYPPMEEQLDMQYWDAVNGTTVWQDTIAAIKAKYQPVV